MAEIRDRLEAIEARLDRLLSLSVAGPSRVLSDESVRQAVCTSPPVRGD